MHSRNVSEIVGIRTLFQDGGDLRVIVEAMKIIMGICKFYDRGLEKGEMYEKLEELQVHDTFPGANALVERNLVGAYEICKSKANSCGETVGTRALVMVREISYTPDHISGKLIL